MFRLNIQHSWWSLNTFSFFLPSDRILVKFSLHSTLWPLWPLRTVSYHRHIMGLRPTQSIRHILTWMDTLRRWCANGQDTSLPYILSCYLFGTSRLMAVKMCTVKRLFWSRPWQRGGWGAVLMGSRVTVLFVWHRVSIGQRHSLRDRKFVLNLRIIHGSCY